MFKLKSKQKKKKKKKRKRKNTELKTSLAMPWHGKSGCTI